MNTSQSSLDGFLKNSRPIEPVSTSQEIRDRGSTFVANIFHATTPEAAKAKVDYLRNVTHSSKRATHEIAAWRCMVLKGGRTGLDGPDDFELKNGFSDDGEQWAGSKILKTMESLAILDAVVIVSRWYGGIMLGPVRFSHIETCASEVCRAFKKSEELKEAITMLSTLDDILNQLRFELASLSSDGKKASSADGPSKKPDYSSWTPDDLPKAKRVIAAREKAIVTVKKMIAKRREG
ncbi:ribosomal protein S5 domain 2-like protein [Dendrothele bispora CBS 962.96]|uniref:Ribosomal protein S5 domain 2-like protein n=1 Tax=Dendrothele bispora (strain CBS 962.96) TaxID=1314807 RepID=A0A4S8MS05_DENBC|nr:ribosomal protein S5 domain 2-like protein [Dendrothele bispora CBS 962.96]